MGNIKYGTKFKARPLKSPGMRRQRMKAQMQRLVKAGWAKEKVAKLDAMALREALKTL
jgi:hypothetical protein